MIKLDNRTILDNGVVVFDMDGAIDQLLIDINSYIIVQTSEPCKEVEGVSIINNSDIDAIGAEIKPMCWLWSSKVDITDILIEELIRRDIYDEAHIARLDEEYTYIVNNNLVEFFQRLYDISTLFEENDIVHGFGRGSSCASLILFLIKIHDIDPVLYNIDINEFFKNNCPK